MYFLSLNVLYNLGFDDDDDDNDDDDDDNDGGDVDSDDDDEEDFHQHLNVFLGDFFYLYLFK